MSPSGNVTFYLAGIFDTFEKFLLYSLSRDFESSTDMSLLNNQSAFLSRLSLYITDNNTTSLKLYKP